MQRVPLVVPAQLVGFVPGFVVCYAKYLVIKVTCTCVNFTCTKGIFVGAQIQGPSECIPMHWSIMYDFYYSPPPLRKHGLV